MACSPCASGSFSVDQGAPTAQTWLSGCDVSAALRWLPTRTRILAEARAACPLSLSLSLSTSNGPHILLRPLNHRAVLFDANEMYRRRKRSSSNASGRSLAPFRPDCTRSSVLFRRGLGVQRVAVLCRIVWARWYAPHRCNCVEDCWNRSNPPVTRVGLLVPSAQS